VVFRRRSVATKRAFLLVCKTFHDLTLPDLYESIIISRWTSIKGLNAGLLASRWRQGPAFDVGRWTRRIDIVPKSSDLPAGDLVEVFQYLPHLVIATGPGTTSMRLLGIDAPSMILEGLGRYCVTSIRCIIWSSPPPQELADTKLLQLIRAAPQLSIIRGAYITVHEHNVHELLTCLPRMRSVFLEVCPAAPVVMDTRGISAEASLEVTFSSGLDKRWETSPGMLSAIGMFIRRLTIPAETLTHQTFRTIENCCPSLRQLILSTTQWSNLLLWTLRDAALKLPAQVTQLGLRSQKHQHKRHHYQALSEALLRLEAPHLVLIKFLESGNVDDFRKHPRVLYALADDLASRRVILQDHVGISIAARR
jgi:hypothetical protein